MKDEFYKNGVYRISQKFDYSDILQEIYKKLLKDEWDPLHKELKDYADYWKAVHFIKGGEKTDYYDKFPEIDKVRRFFECRLSGLALYSAMPGTHIHPHIDMSGHLAFGRLRFHVPIKTNRRVSITMGARNPVTYHMGLNELWALDTSHTHSVKNESDEVRIHLMVEVYTNKWVWKMLPPRNIHYFLHVFTFFAYSVPRALLRGSNLPKDYYRRWKKRLGFGKEANSDR